jgi:hypothetical protein
VPVVLERLAHEALDVALVAQDALPDDAVVIEGGVFISGEFEPRASKVELAFAALCEATLVLAALFAHAFMATPPGGSNARMRAISGLANPFSGAYECYGEATSTWRTGRSLPVRSSCRG